MFRFRQRLAVVVQRKLADLVRHLLLKQFGKKLGRSIRLIHLDKNGGALEQRTLAERSVLHLGNLRIGLRGLRRIPAQPKRFAQPEVEQIAVAARGKILKQLRILRCGKLVHASAKKGVREDATILFSTTICQSPAERKCNRRHQHQCRQVSETSECHDYCGRDLTGAGGSASPSSAPA